MADAGYGLSARFRQGLTARNSWAVGIPRHLKVYPCLIPDGSNGCAARPSPSGALHDTSINPAAERCTDDGRNWQKHQLRIRHEGKTQGSLCCRPRVCVADGSPQRIKDKTS